MHTIQECLDTLGVTSEDLDNGELTLDEEFKSIKKIYFRQILQSHPDKGGDPEVFRQIQTSFESLRKLYQSKSLQTFCGDTAAEQEVPDYDDVEEEFRNSATGAEPGSSGFASWTYYEEAAKEDMPGYCVEPAKSGRSTCKQKTKSAKKCRPGFETIAKDELRVGSLDKESGKYGRFSHLQCWRVPSRVWLGLGGLFDPVFVPPATKRGKGHYVSSATSNFKFFGQNVDDNNKIKNDEDEDAAMVVTEESALQYDETTIQICLRALEQMDEVTICGFTDLSKEQKLLVVNHVLNQEHHAKLAPKLYQDRQNQAAAAAVPIKQNGEAEEDIKMPALPSFTAKVTSAAPTRTPMVTPSSEDRVLSHSDTKGSGSASTDLAITGSAKKKKAGRFVAPIPGKNGAPSNILQGQVCVMTGVFPEIGGGVGLTLGKEKTKAMIVSFGGRVTGSISGKTTLLIAGKEPGASKVGQARSRGISIIGLHELKLVCEGQKELEKAEPACLEGGFSSGYMGRGGLALTMSEEELNNLRKAPPKSSPSSASAAVGMKAIEADPTASANSETKKKPAAKTKSKKKGTTRKAATKKVEITKTKRKTAPTSKTPCAAAQRAAACAMYENDDAIDGTCSDEEGLLPATNKKKRKAASTIKTVATETAAAVSQGTENQNPNDAVKGNPRDAKKRKTTKSTTKAAVAVSEGNPAAKTNGNDTSIDDTEQNEQPSSVAAATFPDLEKLKVAELKALCKLKGIQVSGAKATLKNRLEGHVANATGAAAI